VKPAQIKSFLIAWYKFMRRGCERRTKLDRDLAMKACAACQYRKGARCGMCGCWVALKTWCIDEHCPAGKW
jgi:hypothetical protein